MYLVKCECGCFYKLDEESLKNSQINQNRTCPNCGANHALEDNPTIRSLSKTGMEIMRIPDGTRLEVKLIL